MRWMTIAALVAARAWPGGGRARTRRPRCHRHGADQLLGTFHFSDAGLDDYKPKHDVDILSEKRQAELAEVLEALAAYRPTKIAVEWMTRAPGTDRRDLPRLRRGAGREAAEQRFTIRQIRHAAQLASRSGSISSTRRSGTTSRGSIPTSTRRSTASAASSLDMARPFRARDQPLRRRAEGARTTLREYPRRL